MSDKNWHEKWLKVKKIAEEILKIDEVDKVYINEIFKKIMITQKDNENNDKFLATHEDLKKKIKEITADLPQPWRVIYGNWYRRHKKNKKEFLQKVKEIAKQIENLSEVQLVEINEFHKEIFIRLYDFDDEDEEKYFEECRKFEDKVKEITGDYPTPSDSTSLECYIYFEEIKF